MYLEKLRLENVSPIDIVDLSLPFTENGAPKPLILVGENGAGKSIFLSHTVSSMINAHNSIYEDGDTEKGFVFKLRSPLYIRHGQNYSLSTLDFSNGLQETESIKPSEVGLRGYQRHFSSFQVLEYDSSERNELLPFQLSRRSSNKYFPTRGASPIFPAKSLRRPRLA